MALQHLENFALHYARTLHLWRKRFITNKAQVEALGFDGLFQRAWDYYFCYCEAGFKTQVLQLLHLVWSRVGEAPSFTSFACRDEPQSRSLENGIS